MKQYDIKSMVSGDKKVRFTHFRRNELWYVTECGFTFAVPASDVGDATFNHEERAMMLMRYIRKQIEANKAGLAESTNGVVALNHFDGIEGATNFAPNCC